MDEARPSSPILATPVAAPACVAGFLSFRYRLSRCSVEQGSSQACIDLPVISASSTISTSAVGTEGPRDAARFVGQDVTSTHVPDALAQPSDSSTTPIPVVGKENATESMPPLPVKIVTVLGLPAPSSALIPLSRGEDRAYCHSTVPSPIL
ncbi:hypothetical protein Bca101_057687 [Brassica carinata]